TPARSSLPISWVIRRAKARFSVSRIPAACSITSRRVVKPVCRHAEAAKTARWMARSMSASECGSNWRTSSQVAGLMVRINAWGGGGESPEKAYGGGKDLLEALDGAKSEGQVSRGRGRPRHIAFGVMGCSRGQAAGAHRPQLFFVRVRVLFGASGQDLDIRELERADYFAKEGSFALM